MWGEVKEKLLAAKRSGIKKVIVPRKNDADVKDMSEEITNDLTLVFADHIGDVIREALVHDQ
jgi:ATP-dependent Lon protease